MMTFQQAHRIAREVLTNRRRFTNAVIDYIIWNDTGYPSFFTGDPEAELRRQLMEFASRIAPTGEVAP